MTIIAEYRRRNAAKVLDDIAKVYPKKQPHKHVFRRHHEESIVRMGGNFCLPDEEA